MMRLQEDGVWSETHKLLIRVRSSRNQAEGIIEKDEIEQYLLHSTPLVLDF